MKLANEVICDVFIRIFVLFFSISFKHPVASHKREVSFLNRGGRSGTISNIQYIEILKLLDQPVHLTHVCLIKSTEKRARTQAGIIVGH